MRIGKLGLPIFLVGQLLLMGACEKVEKEDTNVIINLLVNDSDMQSASVTGKDLLWSKSQIKWKDSTGRIQFKANIHGADLLLIKGNTTYKDFRCYLEAGETLNVIYNRHAYQVVGTSIAARQNRLLINLDHKRRVLLDNQSDTTLKQDVYGLRVYKQIEKLISDFIKDNPETSPGFIKFIRFDNKYQYLNSQLEAFKLSSVIKKQWSKHDLEIYQSVIADSDYPEAYFSKSYRQLLYNYLIYLRFNDPDFLFNATSDPVKNEKYLASLLKCKELQDYQMAVSIKELLQVDYYSDVKSAIDEYAGYWKEFLLDVYNTVITRANYSNKIQTSHTDEIFLKWTTLSGVSMNLENYKGSWVYFVIGKNEYGYSPHETYYLDMLNEQLKDLNCFSVFFSEAKNNRNIYENVQIIYIDEATLQNSLNTKYLPASLLINPKGGIEMVNLPNASSGMLKSILISKLNNEKLNTASD